jgi:hypothetical protein
MVKKNKPKKKIGRNDSCTCGSGKKYKKCCGRISSKSSGSRKTDQNDLKNSFREFNQSELIATLGGLQLLPENHSQTIRLENATRIACCTMGDGSKKIQQLEFKTLLNNYLPSNGPIGRLEDPPEEMFTVNMIYYGGNYVMYPGRTSGEIYTLKNLLKAIWRYKEEFSEDYFTFVRFSSQFMFTIINNIAKSLDHHRYMDGIDRWGEDIEIPSEQNLIALRDAVSFTKAEIIDLFKKYKLEIKPLIPFLIPVRYNGGQIKDLAVDALGISPLVCMEDKIIVATPGLVPSALRHLIIGVSKDFEMNEVLANRFRDNLWGEVKNNLMHMGFNPLKIEVPPWQWKSLIKEGFFKIDSDKIAYAHLINDDLSDYDEKHLFGNYKIDKFDEIMNKRYETIVKFLTGKNSFCKEVFILLIFGNSGRDVYDTNIPKTPNKSRLLSLRADELEIVTELRDCDSLSLWKFANAKANFLKSKELLASSFLDEYAYYIDHRFSFYTDENFNPIVLFTDQGHGLRAKSAVLNDSHAALRYEQLNEIHHIPVQKMDGDESIPIYVPDDYRAFGHLVEGYNPPLWVESKYNINEIPNSLKTMYLEFASTIAYWLWQLMPNLKTHLDPLGKLPIRIIFNLETHQTWEDRINDVKNFGKNTDSIPKFVTDIIDRTIEFSIPDEIINPLERDDNQGERLMMDELIHSFCIMLNNSGLGDSINVSERERILDIHMPLGIKKKFIAITSSHIPSLNPQNLPKLRMIQEYDMEEQLNNLVGRLGSTSPNYGEIKDKVDRIKLCEDLVDVIYLELRSYISKFEWKSILEKLICSNEAIWNRKAFDHVNTAPSIACYGDIQSRVQKNIKEVELLDKTALSTRTLLEMISAEPPMGSQKVSMEDMDKLVAMTWNLIYWAMISDRIKYNLADIKMAILKTGRIGTEKEKIESLWKPFIESKTLETVESDIDKFKSHFKAPNSSEVNKPDELIDNAFKAEFGFDLEDIAGFHATLTLIGFEQKLPGIYLSDLQKKIINELGWSKEKINDIIDLFSLKPRKKWETPPEGFKTSDIWPWIYGRKLSYIRKPLIIGPEPIEDPLVFWGPRHVDESGKYLIELIMYGRYYNDENTTPEMNQLLGKIRNDMGDEFTNEVKEWFEINTSLEIHREVPIGPRRKFKSEKDLGDVDIFVIDKKNKVIFSIECKNMRWGRNSNEMANELRKLIGTDNNNNNNKSWIKKHLNRDKWLKDNLNLLVAEYQLEPGFRVRSLFLTSKEIPTPYIRNMEIPFISFTKLKREGIVVLDEIV